MKQVEQRLAEEEVTNAGAEEAAADVHAEVREQSEREEAAAAPSLAKAWKDVKAQLHKFSSPHAQSHAQAQKGAVKQQPQAPVKEQAKAAPPAASPMRPTGPSAANAASQANLKAVQKNMLAGTMRNEKLPDAFALLREAKEAGVLFVEDSMRDGHTEDLEDPDLAAAVEECIRLCFGVRGVLRIGAGRNDRHEPIIVITTTHGFSEASLAQVPEKVHLFDTLIAIPFDLLPLKRER